MNLFLRNFSLLLLFFTAIPSLVIAGKKNHPKKIKIRPDTTNYFTSDQPTTKAKARDKRLKKRKKHRNLQLNRERKQRMRKYGR